MDILLCRGELLSLVRYKYDFQGPSLHRVAKIKIPNWLTFELLPFFVDLSAGLAGSVAAIGGEEK